MKNFNKVSFLVLAFLFGMFSFEPAFAQVVQDNMDYESLAVYLWDGAGKFTNFRNKPKGDIVGKISTEEIVTLAVDRVEKGWWHVVDGQAEVLDGDTKVFNNGEAWVHYSVLGIGTRNYDGQKLTLRDNPSETAKAVFSFTDEITLRPMEMKDGWVKVMTLDGKHTGWIEDTWLCGNPVSNCC